MTDPQEQALRPTLDDLKRQRDGHLWAMPSVHRRIWRPSEWLVERGGAGESVRMSWNGPAVREWERLFGDRPWIMPEELPREQARRIAALRREMDEREENDLVGWESR